MGVGKFLRRADEAVQDTKQSVSVIGVVAIVGFIIAVVGLIISVVRR